MKLLFGTLCWLSLTALGSPTPNWTSCPSSEYFVELIQLDHRAASRAILSCSGNLDMRPLVPYIVRYRLYELFDLVSPSFWLEFLETRESQCVLGANVTAQMTLIAEQVRNGKIKPEIIPGLLQASFEEETLNSDTRILSFFKDVAVTPLWDCFGIFGQLSLYQTCTTLYTAYKSLIQTAYTDENPEMGRKLSFRKIFKLWRLSAQDSWKRENLQLFLGIHRDFKHYATYVFGDALDEFHHFPWNHSIEEEYKSSNTAHSPVTQMMLYGIDPDVIGVLIKVFSEYMGQEWSHHLAHKLVISMRNDLPMSFIRTAIKQGKVDFSTLIEYILLPDPDPQLSSLLVDLIEKPAVWNPIKLSIFIECTWKKSQLEDILDSIPTKSVGLSLDAMRHLLAVGVDFAKISRPVNGVGLFIFDKVDESMVVKLLVSGRSDDHFVLTVLKNISPIWKPDQRHAQLAFDLGYSSELIHWMVTSKTT